MTDRPSRLLTAALRYAELGFAVFPVRPGGKRPITANGFHDATTDHVVIEAWWRDTPDANIGLPCGPNGLLVLDVDCHDGGADGRDTLARLCGEPNPDLGTPTARTGGGGIHFVFALPEWPDWKAPRSAGPGLDVQVAGYIVAAPSQHESGKPYTWQFGRGLLDIKPAPVPAWLEAAIRRPEPDYAPLPGEDRPYYTDQSEADTAREALDYIPEQYADDYHGWVRVGMALHSAGVTCAEWDEWSKQSEKWEHGACEKKWRTFEPGGGVGIGTLIDLAREGEPDFLRPGWQEVRAARRGANQQSTPRRAKPPAPRVAQAGRDGQDGPADTEPTLPTIVANGRDLPELLAEAIAATCRANRPPRIMMRQDALVEVGQDERGRAVIRPLPPHGLRLRMTEAAVWVSVSQGRGGERKSTPAVPSEHVVQAALSPQAREKWTVPPLEVVTETPTLRPDGTVITEPGYDPATRLFYAPPPGLEVPPIPTHPQQAEARAALHTVAGLFDDFPFESQADRANLLALLLTPIVRPAISRAVPLILLDAPQQGTGKSLIADVTQLIAMGYIAADAAPANDNDDEWRKRLFSVLLSGNAVINFDNLEGRLRAPALAMALTTPDFRDRIMGTQTTVSLPVRVTWIATGNNIQLGGDLARRCVRCRLDARTDRPWERSGFKHDDLKGYVRANRGALLAALLTAARGWYAAGRPKAAGLPRMGEYAEWVNIVGGVLAFCGVEGFLETQEVLYTEADSDAADWLAFLDAWHAWNPHPVTAREVCDAVGEATQATTRLDFGGTTDAALADLADAVPEVIMGADGRINTKRLGSQLKTLVGRRYGPDGLRVERAGQDGHAKALRYRACRDTPDEE